MYAFIKLRIDKEVGFGAATKSVRAKSRKGGRGGSPSSPAYLEKWQCGNGPLALHMRRSAPEPIPKVLCIIVLCVLSCIAKRSGGNGLGQVHVFTQLGCE